jgi:serine protease
MKATSFCLLFLITFTLNAHAHLPIANTAPFNVAALIDAATPLFESKQTYLEDAPVGVGARTAWGLSGGTGSNVKVVDIETCFTTDHEDFNPAFYIGNNPVAKCSSPDHGTAVWGEIAAKKDGKGVSGIAYDVRYGVYGFIEGDQADMSADYIAGINKGIQGAMDQLSAGDVMVIEQEMTGPDSFTSVDYWPEILEKLKEATAKGIICVEAAGNGSSDLDSEKYMKAFDLNVKDSGCIMVGAAGRDMNRLDFSNYGSRIDVAGFGDRVATTGYGQLFNGGPFRQYTASFNGTSSATPIVAGVIAVVSSIAKQKGRTLTSLEMRAALRATGTPQNAKTKAQRIGNLPDIASLLKYLELN